MNKDSSIRLSEYFKRELSHFEWLVYEKLISGMDYREIAKKMNKSFKSIDNTIQRIRKKGSEWFKNID